MFVPRGLPWPCPAVLPDNIITIYFSVPLAAPRASEGLLELFQEQTSFSHWCNARESGNEPTRGKVGQCASGVINGIQEGGGERLSQSFRLSGQ